TFRGALEAAELHDLPHEVLDAGELHGRYPAYAGFDASTWVVFQPDGGFLLAERSVRAHLDAAVAAGAELRFETPVRAWEPTASGGVRVMTERAVVEADRL